MIKNIAIALVTAGTLGACSLAPHYLRPEAPVADAYPASATGKTERNATEIGWREFFSD